VRLEAESLAVLTALRQSAAEFNLQAVETVLAALLAEGHAVVLLSSFVGKLCSRYACLHLASRQACGFA